MLVALGVFLANSTAWAQFPGRTTGTAFFPEFPVRGPLVIFPTLTLGVEYNDNVFLTNNRKRSDYIGGVTPGIQVVIESVTYRWAVGYSLTGEKYLHNTQLDNSIQRQSFFITGTHRLSPQFTLTLNELFAEDKSTSQVGLDNIAVGRRTSRNNTFSPGFVWQFTPQTSLRTELGYTLQRFDDPTAAGSNVYRLTSDFRHDFTPRFTGVLGYEGRYIDVDRQIPVITHTPRFGVIYRFTPATTATVIVGPTVRLVRNEMSIDPFGEASIVSLFAWGTLTGYANHYVGTAGGLGGTTENTSAGVLLRLTSLLRDLVVEVGPGYSIAKSTGGGNAIDVRSLSLDVRASYRLTSWLAAVASYRFFQQRSDSTGSTLAADLDQNRAFLGAQLGYPFKFD